MGLLDRLLARVRVALGEPLAKSLRRRLRAARPWRIAELREGLHGRISGTVRVLDGATLVASLTGRPCVYYQVEIIQFGALGEGFAQELLGLDKRGVPFLLADDGHHAIIEPAFAELLVRSTVHEVKASSARTLQPAQRALLERLGALGRAQRSSGAIRFTETIVELDATIAIAGTAAREADPQALAERGFRDDAQTRLRFGGAPKLPLLIGDPPR